MSDWTFPSPESEARFCLQLARTSGVEATRRLIIVTTEEQAELRDWAAKNPQLQAHIEAAIKFRKRVLILFDRLVSEEEVRKKRAA